MDRPVTGGGRCCPGSTLPAAPLARMFFSSSGSDERPNASSWVMIRLREEHRQALVEGLHAELRLSDLHRRVDLVDLVLADQVPDRRVGDHDLQGKAPSRPPAFWSRAWLSTPSSTKDSWARICGCW